MILSKTLRKKGGIIINKIKFFLIFFFSIIIGSITTFNVYAEEATFYEAEYIDGIYMKKYNPYNKITYYQTARFFRKTNTNEFAYCIEPFAFFNHLDTYTSTLNPNNLSTSQIDKISKIAHFGYGYKNHTDVKWYAITQFMIWQAADPNGDYYFTDTLSGNRITLFEAEINEINNLVNTYTKLPSINNKTYTIVEDNPLMIEDTNKIINSFKIDDKKVSIKGNTINITPLKEGTYTFTAYKQENVYNQPYIFYQANDSQNLIRTGNLNKLETKFTVKVIPTSIELKKIDKDTKETTPQGEASLDGAIYTLYDSNMKELQELRIKNNLALLSNLNFGKYYIKEKAPGKGYTKDDTTYEININENNNKIKLVLENKVIEKKIIIQKKYGTATNLINEENISFNVVNNNKELIKTLTTDSNGHIEITLPFGSYTFIQINSTEGYSKVEPFTIEVIDSKEEEIILRDLQIPVPNTHTEKDNYNIFTILLILFLL